MKKLKGKIVNHNNSFIGEIIFDEKINNINKIKSNQYDNYITKISSAPIPLAHPSYENGNNYTYDMSNII